MAQTMITVKCQRWCIFSIIYFCVVYALEKNNAPAAVNQKSSEYKITSNKQLQDIFNMILNSKNSNRGGYIIQARTDPKRLIFISEKDSNDSHLAKNVAASTASHSSRDKSVHRLKADSSLHSSKDNATHVTISDKLVTPHPEEQLPFFDNINVHLYLKDFEKRINLKPKYDWIVRGYEGEGRLKRQSESGKKIDGQKSEVNEEAMQAMKRVIFIRCPFYACPRGHICDYYTRSCRPILYPDFDF